MNNLRQNTGGFDKEDKTLRQLSWIIKKWSHFICSVIYNKKGCQTAHSHRIQKPNCIHWEKRSIVAKFHGKTEDTAHLISAAPNLEAHFYFCLSDSSSVLHFTNSQTILLCSTGWVWKHSVRASMRECQSGFIHQRTDTSVSTRWVHGRSPSSGRQRATLWGADIGSSPRGG